MDTKLISVAVTVAVVAGGLGYVVGVNSGKSRGVVQNTPLGTLPVPVVNTEIKALSGTIQEVKTNSIMLRVPSMNPADATQDIREVTVGGATKIVRVTMKDQKVFMSEMEAYQKKLISVPPATDGKPSVPPPMPSSSIETVIALSDMKVGESVSVEADGDIKNAKKFEAVKISIYMAPPASVVPSVPPKTN